MKRFAVLALALAFPSAMYPAVIVLNAFLSGGNEIPVVVSAGTGSATVTLDTVAHTLLLNVTFSGLNTIDMAAHIHCCIPQPANTGVATTVPAFPGFPLNVTSGTYSGTLNLLDAGSYNPTFVTNNGGTVAAADAVFESGLVSNMTYLNIHTSSSPGGEIRGALVAVPEPSTAILAAALLAVAALRRRV